MLAQRMSLFSGSGTAKARAAAKSAADAGHEIIDLTAGEIWSDLAPIIREGAIAAIHRGINRYTDTVGTQALREAIARKVSLETGQFWSAEEIAVTMGAKQALFNTAMVLLNPGDEVLIPAPYWTTFPAQVLIAGGKPVFVDTRHTGYLPAVRDLERALTPKTRVIVVNTPSNPTGVVYDGDTLIGIAELALSNNLWVIFDECYGAFAYEPHIHHPIVSLVPGLRARTLIVNSFSKALALTGWRIGYLAGPKEVITAAKALQSHTTSNPNVIAQHAVLAHLERNDKTYENRLRVQLTTARVHGLEALSSLSRVPAPKAEGGFYFYLDLSTLLRSKPANGAAKTADDVAQTLLAQAGVACVSGTAFGDPMGLRLSYGIPVDKLEAGLNRLTAALNAWD
jgi:aspartate aminotransferase